jgi:hypothetical protein
VILTITNPRFRVCGRGFFFSIAVFALSCAAAAAQCSQAARSVAVSEKTTAPAQDALASGASNESSSSSGTPGVVRFATGTPITVLEGTSLQVINDTDISSRTTKSGARIAFSVTRDVVVDGILVIPCGATVFGTVVEEKRAHLVGASNLALKLTGLNLDGRSYPLYTTPFKVVGLSKTRPTIYKVATGAAAGALAMDVMATTPGMVTGPVSGTDLAKVDAVGAGMGAGVGTAVAAVTSRPSIALIPAESEIEFTLVSPVAVFPVDQRTAARLSQGMRQGGPVLYVRGENQ